MKRMKTLKLLGLLTAAICSQSIFSCALADEARKPIEGGDAPSSTTTGGEAGDNEQGVLFPYTLLDQALANNVERDGNVSYAHLKDNPYLKRFLRAVANADLKQFPTFEYYEEDPKTNRKTKKRIDRTAELVFWINATNAHTFDAIASAYPIKSIDDIKGFETAQTHNVAGKNYSLKELRLKVADFGDPRALFALTSGTAGGVLPMTSAVRTIDFDDSMNFAVQTFVNDPRNVSVNRIQGIVTLSDTFLEASNAYKLTGRMRDDAIRAVLAGYTSGNGKGYFGSGSYKIDFKKSDRILNDKTSRGTSSE